MPAGRIKKLRASNRVMRSLNMEDKIIEAISHIRNKNEHRVNKEKKYSITW